MRIGMATSHRQNLRAQCSAPRIASLQTTSTAQHQQRASYTIFGLVRMPSRWSATIFCLQIRCAKITFFSTFSIFRFSIPLDAMHQQRLIPLTSGLLSSLTRTYPMHRSVFSQGNSYIIIATSLSPRFGLAEKGSLAKKLGILGALHGSLEYEECGQRTF